MNTINNKFSFARLGAVLKCDLVEHRWSNIAAFFILFAAFLASQLANMNSIIGTGLRHSIQPDQYMPSLAANFVPFFYGVLSLALMCAAADMCGVPLKTKGRGLNYLMMPATNMEKFVARALVNTILLIVMAFAALLLADLVRMLFVPLFEVKEFYGFTLPRILAEFGETFSSAYRTGGEVWGPTVDGTVRVIGFSAYYGAVNVTTMVAAFLFAHSLFILGGCIWRKAAIIKIWITQIVVTSAVVWIFVKLEPYVLPWLGDVLTSLFETEQQAGMTLMNIAIPVLLALTALNWWLGYRLFSRKQVVAPQHHRGGKHLHQLFPSRK
ncbi:MAG: hypothetical protein J6C15_04695 [Bacteroidaceae bacterium]|nr:hypothetical protein [Bacteroidaceae bacterium]MBO5134434.1 hypothetical protein [Bacteroidaceae bacterium]